MSYIENLGRVKGDNGGVYFPIVTQSGSNYEIHWELQETISEEPEPVIIAPQVYIPTVENGVLSFTLETPTLSTLPSVNIKGEKGDAGSVQIEFVESIPTTGNPNTIYITANNDTYVFNGNVRYQIDNLIELQNYYQKAETHGKYTSGANKSETTYSANEIDTKLGAIEEMQREIRNLLG